MDFRKAIQVIERRTTQFRNIGILSHELENFLNSEGITNLILQICTKYGIQSENQYDVISLIVWYVTKTIPEQEFVNLVSLTPIQQKFFTMFLQELQEKLWDPYDAALAQAKIPYKLLTKLNPEPQEKIQQWLDALSQQYPEQSGEEVDLDALLAQETEQAQQGFSLGDQIRAYANPGQQAPSQPQAQEIKISMPIAPATPIAQQGPKPIEITADASGQQKPMQAPLQQKPADQPTSQVRLEIGQSSGTSAAPEPLSAIQEQPKQVEPVLPSIRFEPLLQKQEGMIPKQVTPSAALQEALGKEPISTQEPQTQRPAEANAAKSLDAIQTQQLPAQTQKNIQSETKPQENQQETGHVIDLTHWNVRT